MENKAVPACPDCQDEQFSPDAGLTRRDFLWSAVRAGAVAAAGGAVLSSPLAYATPHLAQAPAAAAKAATSAPESLVKTLYDSLTSAQKTQVAKAWSDPLRTTVNANWAIVKPNIGEIYTADQQEIIKGILRGVTNEEWYPKILAQMKNDSDGLEFYHVALFHDPGTTKYEWVLTGRHATMRCGGDPADNLAFGGPIFYGHSPKDTEDPGHPDNIFWYQAKRANEVYQMLDGKQRELALIAKAPDESAVKFRKPGEPLPGVPVGSLSRDQKAHVQQVLHDCLAPYRPSDVREVLADLKASGGLDSMNLAFYKQDDLGNDGVWDIWRMEGKAFVWHFRGSPHVHTWVNIGKDTTSAKKA